MSPVVNGAWVQLRDVDLSPEQARALADALNAAADDAESWSKRAWDETWDERLRLRMKADAERLRARSCKGWETRRARVAAVERELARRERA